MLYCVKNGECIILRGCELEFVALVFGAWLLLLNLLNLFSNVGCTWATISFFFYLFYFYFIFLFYFYFFIFFFLLMNISGIVHNSNKFDSTQDKPESRQILITIISRPHKNSYVLLRLAKHRFWKVNHMALGTSN